MTKKDLIIALMQHPGRMDAPVVYRVSGAPTPAGPPETVELVRLSDGGRHCGYGYRSENFNAAAMADDHAMKYEDVVGVEL